MCGQPARRRGEHGRVTVVTAGVHRALAARCPFDAGILIDRHGVDVAAQRHVTARGIRGQHRHGARAGTRAPGHTDRVELRADAGGGVVLGPADLRGPVEVMAQYGRRVEELLQGIRLVDAAEPN